MGITVGEAAAAIEGVSKELMQRVGAHGWNANVIWAKAITWQGPPFSTVEVCDMLDGLAERVNALPAAEIDIDLQNMLDNLPERAESVRLSIAQLSSDYNAVFDNIFLFLRWVSDGLPSPPAKVDWESIKESGLVPLDLRKRLKAVAARLSELEPDSEALAGKIERINEAHDAAVALPTDMQELREKKAEIASAADESKRLSAEAGVHLSEVTELLQKIRRQETAAAAIVTKCEQAFGIATTVGLAGSFKSRALMLNVAAWVWVAGLVAALGAGFWIGKSRFEQLQTALTANPSPTVLWINALMAVLGIGAPIWFAWISTKQIGQNFRLAEDYGFKATVARAYEGYRKEAATLSEGFASRLFESALDRLDEAPIRLLDAKMHGSPLQEFFDHPAIKGAVSSAPELKNDIMRFLQSKLGAAAVAGTAAAGVASAVPANDAATQAAE